MNQVVASQVYHQQDPLLTVRRVAVLRLSGQLYNIYKTSINSMKTVIN